MKIWPWMNIAWDKDDGAGGGEAIEKPAGDGGEPAGGAEDRTPDDDKESDAGGDILGAGSDDDRKVVVPADWPTDWMDKALNDAGLEGDNREKAQKQLERLGGVGNVLKSYLAAQQKISSGEYKKSIEDADTDEEKDELRKAAGIPETPDKYELPKFEAVELEMDDPGVQDFLKDIHEEGVSQKQLSKIMQRVDALVGQHKSQQFENDQSYRMTSEDALRAELGEEYRPRVNLLNRLIKDDSADAPVPKPVIDALLYARDADGNRVINNPAMAKFLTDQALAKYGRGALRTGDQVQAMESREAEIKKIMTNDFNRYLSEGLDKEYAEILASKNR